MARRSKLVDQRQKTQQASIPLTLRDALESSTGRGVSRELVDRAFWLDPDWNDPEAASSIDLDPAASIIDWASALEAVDKRGDKSALLALLRSERAVTRKARDYLADLLERYQLTFWLDPDLNEHWAAALAALQAKKKHTTPSDRRRLFHALLGSAADLPREARAVLVRVIERHKLERKEGTPATPAYDRSEARAMLMRAVADVRELVSKHMRKLPNAEYVRELRARGISPEYVRKLRGGRMSVKGAVDEVADMHGIPLETLAAACADKLGWLRV